MTTYNYGVIIFNIILYTTKSQCKNKHKILIFLYLILQHSKRKHGYIK